MYAVVAKKVNDTRTLTLRARARALARTARTHAETPPGEILGVYPIKFNCAPCASPYVGVETSVIYRRGGHPRYVTCRVFFSLPRVSLIVARLDLS